jgi:hypothetical protein
MKEEGGTDAEDPAASDSNSNDENDGSGAPAAAAAHVGPQGGDGEEDGDGDAVRRIQAECSAMVSLLKRLQREERDLNCQLEILAREALLCGFQPDLVEPPIPKRRRKPTGGGGGGATKKRKEASADEAS